MQQLFDQSDDLSRRELYHIITRVGFDNLPPYIKTASVGDTTDVDAASEAFFASPNDRRFPCHTKAAAGLSNLYYMHQRSKLRPIVRQIMDGRFARLNDFWAMKTDMDKLRAKYDATIPASPPPKLASETVLDGAMPVETDADVAAAAEHLRSHAHLYPLTMRKQAAQKILKMAATRNLTLATRVSSYLSAASGAALPAHPMDMSAGLLERAQTFASRKQLKVAADLRKAASVVESLGDSHPSEWSKVAAQLVDWVDRLDEAGHIKYSTLRTPEELFYRPEHRSMAEKMAASLVKLGGLARYTYRLSDLALASPSVFGSVSEKLLNEVSTDYMSTDSAKIKAAVEKLPPGQASRLADALKWVGIDSIVLSHVPSFRDRDFDSNSALV